MANNTLDIREPYKSLPLLQFKGSAYVRILNLAYDTDDAPLSGTLEIIRPEPSTEFYALSYVWGKFHSPAHIVTCNGHDVPITTNCHDALQSIRRLVHSSFPIWVDAICIDQQNEKEKEMQIPLMLDIYSNAFLVLIWLGKGNDLFRQAFEVISAAYCFTSTKDDIAIEIQLIKSCYKALKKGLGLLQSVRRLKAMIADAGITAEQLDLDCDWLHRAWTMQEFLLSSNPVFLIGHQIIPAEVLEGAYYFSAATSGMKNWRETILPKHVFGIPGTRTMTAMIDWAHIGTQWQYINMIRWETSDSIHNLALKRELTLFAVMTLRDIRTRQSSNLHDRVYSLHAIMQYVYKVAPPPPDYHRPIALVYEEFFVYLLSLDSLYLDLIADSGTHQALHGAPSWLPNWGISMEERTWIQASTIHDASEEILSRPAMVRTQMSPDMPGNIWSLEGRTLRVPLAFQGSLVFCATLHDQASELVIAGPVFGQDNHKITASSQISTKYRPQLSVLELLFRWIDESLRCAPFVTKFDAIRIVSALLDIRDPEFGRRILQEPSFSDALRDMVDIINYLNDDEARTRFQTYDTTSLALVFLDKIAEVPNTLRLLQELYENMRGRRTLFTCEDGEIGSGPATMMLGDRIAAIEGVQTLMALRPQQSTSESESSYVVIGPVLFSSVAVSDQIKGSWDKKETVSLV